jgi:hypothetical protein
MQSSEEMRTSLFTARAGSKSLRTTVPDTYVTMLDLKAGDKIDWTHEIVNNEVIIKIRKAKK